MHDNWLDITSRLAVGAIHEMDVNGIAVPDRRTAGTARPEQGNLRAPENRATLAPSARLWSLADGAATPYGVRVRDAPVDVRPMATRLVAAATERNTAPIILSYTNRTGFEHLGFRVERIHAGSREAAQMQEDEISALWNLAIVIDVEDIKLLG